MGKKCASRAGVDVVSLRPARPADLAGWLELAREVEHLFGPMVEVPEFRLALEEAMTQERALCAVLPGGDGATRVVGGIVVSPEPTTVDWLVVAGERRGTGLGRLLLAAALQRLDARRPVTVQTFAPGCADGDAARALYRAFGFEDRQLAEPTPAGIPTVIMVRPGRG